MFDSKRRRTRHAILPAVLVLVLLGVGSVGVRHVGRARADGDAEFDDAALILTEPNALRALEGRGLSLGRVMGAGQEDTASLDRSPLGHALFASVERDVVARHADPETSFVTSERARPVRRLFDPSWLHSDHAHFELVGVVNRLDRALIDPNTCGEIRLIYRLALDPPQRPTTRLPMTVNVIFTQAKIAGECQTLAREWLALERDRTPDAIVRHPLQFIVAERRGEQLVAKSFDKLEIDYQLMHEEPRTRTSDDHAEYILRGYRREGEALREDALLDTPADDAFDAARRSALVRWIGENLGAIDDGSASIPMELLGEAPVTRAVSVAPRGLSRIENRPFGRQFRAPNEAFGALFLADSDTRIVRSPAGLVRRLDQMTCPGCHATRSIAGFHLVGDERDPSASFGALVSGRSQHLSEELHWRRRFLSSALRGEPFREPRPLPEHDVLDRNGVPDVAAPGGYGAHCGVDRNDATSRDWRCAGGLVCNKLHAEDEVGTCVYAAAEPGEPCEITSREPEQGSVRPRLRALREVACRPSVDLPADSFESGCFPNRSFPGGMCSVEERCLARDNHAECSESEPVPHIVPGRIYPAVTKDALAIGFRVPRDAAKENCVEKDEPIERCLSRSENASRVLSRACNANRPCRDDFTCVRVISESGDGPASYGACVPPYFVFQLRVDGPRLDRR